MPSITLHLLKIKVTACKYPANISLVRKWYSLPYNSQGLEEDLAAVTQGRERLQREKNQTEQELEEAKFARQTMEQKLRAENERLNKEREELRKEVEKERGALREMSAALTSERHQNELIKVE